MSNCLFCDSYQTWSQHGNILTERPNLYSILSITPASPGQAIIVPKAHVETMKSLDTAVYGTLFTFVEETFEALIQRYYQNPEGIERLREFYRKLSVDENVKPNFREMNAAMLLEEAHLEVKPLDYNLGMNKGDCAGQSQEHLHIHLFPRRNVGNTKGIVTAMGRLLGTYKRK